MAAEVAAGVGAAGAAGGGGGVAAGVDGDGVGVDDGSGLGADPCSVAEGVAAEAARTRTQRRASMVDGAEPKIGADKTS